jgi:HicB family
MASPPLAQGPKWYYYQKMAPDKTSETIKLNLRLPKKLHRQLQQRASREKTSLNTSILRRLEYALENEPTAEEYRDLRRMSEIMEQQGAPDALGQSFAAINEKLDKLIARAEGAPPPTPSTSVINLLDALKQQIEQSSVSAPEPPTQEAEPEPKLPLTPPSLRKRRE